MKNYISKIIYVLIVTLLALSTVIMPKPNFEIYDQETKRLNERTAAIQQNMTYIRKTAQKIAFNHKNIQAHLAKEQKSQKKQLPESSILNRVKVSVIAGISIGLYYLYKWYYQ